MDRIKNLSLDQKAKLYFMGMVKAGLIDTLPENPKAAFVQQMMDSELEKLLDKEEDPRTKSGMEDDKNSLKEMSKELGYLNENEPTVFDDESMDELLNIILKYVEDPDDAEAELDRFDQGGFDAMSDMVTTNLNRDPEYKAWYNKLHSIKEIGMFHDPLGYEPDDDGEDEDLTFEPEDTDDPDEDLVIIGSRYLDIKSNFKGRPNMTNDELATLGQKVVDKLHKGDKEAALKYIYSQINEGKLLKEVRGPIEKIELHIKKGESVNDLDQYGFETNVDGEPIEDLFDENGLSLRDMSIIYDQRDSMYLMDTEDITKYH